MWPSSLTPSTNLLLTALSPGERESLGSSMERVPLVAGSMLYDVGDALRWAYFPTSGLISLQAMTPDGARLQLAIADRQSFVGVPLLLGEEVTPYLAVVQLPGDAYRIRAAVFLAACTRHARLQQVALRYAHRHLVQIGQAAICYRFHTAFQRLCHWLLVCAEQSHASTIELTQERLAQMLGCPRTTISTVAGRLQDAGLIRQRRGRIHVLNHAALAASACPCRRDNSA